jgi:hypothetical protein
VERIMAAFERVGREEFFAALAREEEASSNFAGVLARIDHDMMFRERLGGKSYAVCRGALTVPGDFVAPAYHALLIGDLNAGGLVDLHDPEAEEGGSFIAIGSVRCSVFSNDYSRATIIDGDLDARDLIINSYPDSGLWITGALATKFFFGEDIWAEVGRGAEMEYGDGYCLPIGYTAAAAQSIRPRHSREASRRLLNLADVSELDSPMLRALVESGEPLFR